MKNIPALITDGEATITSNTVTAAVLTDGEATMTGNTVTASILTDGEATMTGNTVTASILTDEQTAAEEQDEEYANALWRAHGRHLN